MLVPNIEELVKMPELKPVEHATPPAATTAAPVVPTAKPPTKPPATKKK